MVVITDNGSNMVKAFRQTAVASDDREEEDADEKEKDTSDKEEDTRDKEEDTSDKEEDTSDKEEDTSEEEDAIEEEVLGEDFDFIPKELDHEMTFRCYCKRLSCFSHTLQLVMLKFSKHSFKPLLKIVHALVGKVNKSSKVTEALISLCRKSLVRDCPTRWSSSYLMLEWFLELKMH